MLAHSTSPCGFLGARGKSGSWLLLLIESLGRGGDQQGAQARPPPQQGNGPHLPDGSRPAGDSEGWGRAWRRCRPLVHHKVAQTSSSPFLWLEVQSPEVAAFLQTTQPFEICSFQLPPERQGSYSQPEAACLPEAQLCQEQQRLPKGQAFLEPSRHPDPIKNRLAPGQPQG